jgi:hypothetical protein
MEPMTAAEFYDELREYPAERVWRAVRRCRRESRFRPTLAELLDAMLANAQERAAEPSSHRAIEARDPDSLGVPPPADYKAARERFLAASRVPDGQPEERPAGRSRAEQLAELEAIAARDAAEVSERV